ncbi:MAG TPA: hypothetical protein VMH20_17395 [Verrucomicrobiae bacterium]|nr:hypothetical protein [Verrucomicrobiae bacterium]
MSRNSLSVPARFLLSFLLVVVLQAAATPKNLPDAVVRAHTVFVVNETGYNELEYSLILEISKWGRFDLASSAEKADLILRLDNGNHVRALPEGQFPSDNSSNSGDNGGIPKGHTRISLLDPKTNTLLWSDTHKTEGPKVKNGHLLDGLRDAFDAYDKTLR